MKLVGRKKTKDVYEDGENLVLLFKDTVTGDEEGINPGANNVIGEVAGMGKISFEVNRHFFNLLENKGVPTHLISTHEEDLVIKVKKAKLLGAQGLEFVRRFKLRGSFLKRFKTLIEAGYDIVEPITEVTLKDDERGDPLINTSSLIGLGILGRGQVTYLMNLVDFVTNNIHQDLKEKGLDLVDIKVEIGENLGFILIDEISPASMRVEKDGVELTPQEIYRHISM